MKNIFDAHFHIIDPNYPLIPNQGFLPAAFTTDDYLQQTQTLKINGGTVVSGSFQGFDQSYLTHALKILGPNFVGVTQLPAEVSDAELLELNKQQVRGLRFNLKRGGSESQKHLANFAARVFEVCNWHVELYVDSIHFPELESILLKLPKVSIDHLGLSKAGLPILTRLVEKGTDLPSTRAPRPFQKNDIYLIEQNLNIEASEKVLYKNALNFYGMSKNHLATHPTSPVN